MKLEVSAIRALYLMLKSLAPARDHPRLRLRGYGNPATTSRQLPHETLPEVGSFQQTKGVTGAFSWIPLRHPNAAAPKVYSRIVDCWGQEGETIGRSVGNRIKLPLTAATSSSLRHADIALPSGCYLRRRRTYSPRQSPRISIAEFRWMRKSDDRALDLKTRRKQYR